jgi:phospholipid/cholesterol/gamma-HCH transport system substrate-binding protein
MKQKAIELTVGIFVLLGLGAVAYMTLKLGSGELLGRDTYVVEARFANAGGMGKGSSVLLAGVPVGRVEAVRIDPSDFSAIASLRLRKEIRLPSDTMASIKTSGLIGDKFVALAPGADEDEIGEGFRLTLTESAVDLESLIGKMAFGKVEESPEPTPEPAQ